MGAWLSYGLGSMNDDLPSFIVLVSANQADQPLRSSGREMPVHPDRVAGVPGVVGVAVGEVEA